MSRLLIIEDDPPLRDVLEQLLSSEGYAITVVPDHTSGVAALDDEPFDLVITDSIKFTPPYGALESKELHAFQRAAGAVPIVLFTGFVEAQSLDADALGFAAIWQKPLDLDVLLDGIQGLLKGTCPVTP